MLGQSKQRQGPNIVMQWWALDFRLPLVARIFGLIPNFSLMGTTHFLSKTPSKLATSILIMLLSILPTAQPLVLLQRRVVVPKVVLLVAGMYPLSRLLLRPLDLDGLLL